MTYLDENRLIRLGERLEFCNLSINEKHPLILSKNSWLTTLIVHREHNKVMHGGTASTLAQPIDQLTSPLPSDRTNQTPAFSVCGLDFVGPLYVNNFGELQKSYIVLFTFRFTRALQSELVSDMTTNSFLLAFRRFLASDHAKTFLKSKKEIENLSRILSQSMIQNFIAKERIIWKNIIERPPWWGGSYERLVRSAKESLHKILGKALLSCEEMKTILTEIEAVLNPRPLSYMYEENDEPRPLCIF
ncbi:integrase catalytic domain-containing protein [Trichonephila clavipes]|uniref:Integrase catalytic domain-containing protein n=1 Tax=Trichonephila clavipes TaxID=2585209 RepID=A0A8X6V9N6_TRICX|nr:integrase catalytic domain-containing protein [Trichonephila clavipes]